MMLMMLATWAAGLQLATQMLMMLMMLATWGCGAPAGHADAYDAHDACHPGWGAPAGHADAHDAHNAAASLGVAMCMLMMLVAGWVLMRLIMVSMRHAPVLLKQTSGRAQISNSTFSPHVLVEQAMTPPFSTCCGSDSFRNFHTVPQCCMKECLKAIFQVCQIA